MATVSRDRPIDVLRGTLQETNGVDAAWEGGSTAFGSDAALSNARVPAVATAFAMFQHIVAKERLRGRAVDALAFYQSMMLRPLAEALRLFNCPGRRVFGLCCLTRDLPAATCARIVALAFVRDLDDLGAKHDDATRRGSTSASLDCRRTRRAEVSRATESPADTERPKSCPKSRSAASASRSTASAPAPIRASTTRASTPRSAAASRSPRAWSRAS